MIGPMGKTEEIEKVVEWMKSDLSEMISSHISEHFAQAEDGDQLYIYSDE